MSIAGGNIAGAAEDGVSSLLAVIASPETFQAKLAEMREARQQLEAAKAEAGVVGDVVALREQARKALESAKAQEQATLSESVRAISDAKATADAMVREAEFKAAAISNQAAKVIAEASAHFDEVKAKVDALESRAKELESEMNQLAVDKAALDERAKNLVEIDREVNKRKGEFEAALAAARDIIKAL